MRFADDIALLAEQTEGLQKALTGVAQTSQKMGRKLNIQNTKCQFLGAGSKKFHLEVDGQELEQTENFIYLGKNISTQEGSDVKSRIGLARHFLVPVISMTGIMDPPHKVHHIPEHPPKDNPALICASELCKERSYKHRITAVLHCIVKKLLRN